MFKRVRGLKCVAVVHVDGAQGKRVLTIVITYRVCALSPAVDVLTVAAPAVVMANADRVQLHVSAPVICSETV